MKKDKKQWFDQLAIEAETAASKGNMKVVYEITRTLCNEKPKQMEDIKDKNGTIVTRDNEVKARWKEHFNEVLNRPEPPEPAEVVLVDIETYRINIEPPILNEIKTGIKELKKAPGFVDITSELLRAD